MLSTWPLLLAPTLQANVPPPLAPSELYWLDVDGNGALDALASGVVAGRTFVIGGYDGDEHRYEL